MGKTLPLALVTIGIFCSSCSAESSSVSPFVNWLQNGSTKPVGTETDLDSRAAATLYDNSAAALLMAEVSKAPDIGDAKVRKEIALLQFLVKGYLRAFEDFNEIGKKRYEKAYRQCYQSLQSKRKNLPQAEDELLGDYLVRVKNKFNRLQQEIKMVKYSN